MRDWITGTFPAAPSFAASSIKLQQIQDEIEKVIKGKPQVVRMALVALLAKGHLLIEDVPGIGKTTLSQALARSLDCSFQRIQFTSDLLPSDVIGLSIFNEQTGDFEWKSGPIFANVVLADEINRATPKTQSALLEAMAEGQVTAEGVSRPLPAPFMVVATQNPTEHHGTYPLPESQLDRFMLRVRMGYPGKDDEKSILRDRERANPLDMMRAVMSETDLLELQKSAAEVRVDESLTDYLMDIVAATRSHEALELGISPRGSLALFRSAQALALIEGRDFCLPDDIKQMVVPVFAHRIIVNARQISSKRQSDEAEQILGQILQKVPVPV
jgi:MoxR-like ATPase